MPTPRETVIAILTVLREAVSRLPNTIPVASINDPIYRHFHNRDVAEDENAWETLDRAYLRCFQSNPGEPSPTSNVLRGEYGMDLVILSFEELGNHPTMTSEGLKLMALKIRQLVDLVHQRISEAPKITRCNSGGRRPAQKRKKDARGAATAKVSGDHSDPYDADFAPGALSESDGEEMDMEAEKESGIFFFGKPSAGDSAPKGPKSLLIQRGKRPRANTASSQLSPQAKKQAVRRVPEAESNSNSSKKGSSGDDDSRTDDSDRSDKESEETSLRPGRPAYKGDWALSHFRKPKAKTKSDGKHVWSFKCKWCRAVRAVTRSKGCLEWDSEMKEHKAFPRSNFISHIEQHCRKIPADKKRFVAPDSEDDAAQHPTSALGLTRQEFNGALAKAVVQDNHAMTLGEGDGMAEFFQLILPGVRLPSHQTLRRHLDRLYEGLNKQIKLSLKDISRHAIATDAWSSKNSVYTLAGIILFYIDRDWHLQELVLDIVNLDAEHSGSRVGKLVYKSLKAKETAHRAVACITDNASSNALMNEALAKRIRKRDGVHLNAEGMSFTCINHAFHLVCTAILSHLGVIEPGDHFSDVKGDDPEASIDELVDIAGADGQAIPDLESSSSSESDFEADQLEEQLDRELNSEPEEVVTNQAAERSARSGRVRASKNLNVAEKVHEIVVYMTASPKRRKELQEAIGKMCTGDAKHLFVKKSMRIRWNSALEEAERAIALRPALTHVVLVLDANKAGAPRKKAKKLQERWAIRSEEWEMLEMLVEALRPFRTATEAMSQKGAPTLPNVIPTFARLELKLTEQIANLKAVAGQSRAQSGSVSSSLLSGFEAGLSKLRKYQQLAHKSHLCLIATVLNPRLRLKYLEQWPDTHSIAKHLIEYIFESYRVQFDNHDSNATPPNSSRRSNPSPSNPDSPIAGWDKEIYSDIPDFEEKFDQELQEFFQGRYPCKLGTEMLVWWATHQAHFPILARVARDYLCIPAASVSVERLFSQCKLTMTDIRSSMSFETARRRICCQHWMRAGIHSNVINEALDID